MSGVELPFERGAQAVTDVPILLDIFVGRKPRSSVLSIDNSTPEDYSRRLGESRKTGGFCSNI